ncbi:MAG: hypothetical protein ACTH2Q_08500 [Propionibacteriaceae bacterium]
MTPPTAAGRRHLASSPFAPKPADVILEFAVDDQVCHDSYGLGRVTGVEPQAVTVDFSSRSVRIVSPFRKMEHL